MQQQKDMDVTTQIKCPKCGGQAQEANRDLVSKSYKCPGCGDTFSRKNAFFNSKRMAQVAAPATPAPTAKKAPAQADPFDGPDNREDSMGGNVKLERQLVSDLDKLAGIASSAKGSEDASEDIVIKGPDLCSVNVPGTNLFCKKSITPPIARERMPQIPDEMAGAFKKFLEAPYTTQDPQNPEKKIQHAATTCEPDEVLAANLMPTQMDLMVGKTAGIMAKIEKGAAMPPIFISEDNYILDGHHRWAGYVAVQIATGRKQEIKMKVYRIGLPIQDAIDAANEFDRINHIEKKKGVVKQPDPNASQAQPAQQPAQQQTAPAQPAQQPAQPSQEQLQTAAAHYRLFRSKIAKAKI